MNPLPFVSILTPTYNRRQFLGQYLKYIRKQDYPYHRIEILVADDGEDEVGDLLGHIERVRYIRLGQRLPLGEKRNLLAHEARGDILIHFDDDDYYPPNRVSHAVQRLTETDKLIAGSSLCFIYFTSTGKLVASGPFGANHGLDGTFAYRREYLRDHSFDDQAQVRVEARFTGNFSSPMAQLDPQAAILIIQHQHNTWDKNNVSFRATQRKLKEFIPDAADRRFYRYKIGQSGG
jgi:glycosyltransferase involved in cell wall biosynthesis